MDDDCQYYCCGKCKGLFEKLDLLEAHKRLSCDGKPSNSDCQLFACERKKHLGHVLQQENEEPKETPLRTSKRRKGLNVDDDEETPAKKKAKENLAKKLNEKKERVKKSLQDVTSSSVPVPDSPAGRRSSGRVRNMPAKYRDFTHNLKIKEPQDDDVSNAETENKCPGNKHTKSESVKISSDDSARKLTELKAKVSEGKSPEESVTLYKCTECGWAGQQKKVLIEHMRQHNDTSRHNSLSNNTETGKDDTDAESEVTKVAPEEKIELELDDTVANVTVTDSAVASGSTEMEQQEQSGIDENIDVSPMKKIGELVAETVDVVENRTETGVETRTRRYDRIKVEQVKIKDEPENLIKEIFDGEIVKKPNVFTKEQKAELAEKYKQYYRPAENKTKNAENKTKSEGDEEEVENSQEVEKQSSDRNENDDTITDKSDDNDKIGKGKENQTFKKKTVKKKVVIKNSPKSLCVPKDTQTTLWLYYCPICNYTSRHVGFFEHHMTKAHDNGKLWKCDKCEYTHANKGVMRLHRNAHIKPFMCEYCSHKFSSGIDLKKHRYTHTGETPYKCTECEWAGRQKKALIEHMRKHTGDKLKCTADGCNFETFYTWALEQHRRSKHEEGNRFQCAECPYATSDSGSFCKHKKYHQGVKDFRCGQCSYKGVTRSDVLKHMRIHTHEKIYFCDRCQYSSCHSSAFKAHMMSHLGLKLWQCKLCGFSATTRAKVIRHLENKHQSRDKTNAVNLPTKFQLNFDDFKVPHDARSQANIVYEIIEAVEGSTEETGAVVMEGQEGEMSVVTHVDAEQFQGLAGLAAVSEAAAAAHEERTVTQIIVQQVDQDGNPSEDQQHIELTNLPPGGVVSLPGEVVGLPPGVVEFQPGQVMTTTAGDGSNITLLQGQWPADAETVTQQSDGENVVETFIIEEPVA